MCSNRSTTYDVRSVNACEAKATGKQHLYRPPSRVALRLLEFDRASWSLLSGTNYSASRANAMPCPPPMQSVTTPFRGFVTLSVACRSVTSAVTIDDDRDQL